MKLRFNAFNKKNTLSTKSIKMYKTLNIFEYNLSFMHKFNLTLKII